MAPVNPIPPGLRTITPQLTVDGAAEAIDAYKKALGAEERSRMLDPSGKKVWHAELQVGDSMFFLNDAMPEMGGHAHPTSLWLYVDRVDEAFARAEKAGFTVVMPLADMFWGDRTGTLKDKWGNRWNFAQRMKNMTEAEMRAAGEAFAKNDKP